MNTLRRATAFQLTFLLMSCLAKADTPYDPSDDLLAAFGQNCSTVGEQSTAAITQANALRGILQSLKDDPACNDVKGLLDSLSGTLDVTLLQTPLQDEHSNKDFTAEITELELALQAEMAKLNPDAAYVSALQQELASDRIALIKSKRVPGQDRFKNRMSAYRNFQQYASSLIKRLDSNDGCFKKPGRGNLAIQIGAQILSLASGFSNSELVGTAMLGLGTLLDNFMTYVSNHHITEAIKDINDSKIDQAIGCALESMASTYCQARDIDMVIANAEKVRQGLSCSAEWRGVDLISRDMNSFLGWMVRLGGGTPSTGSPQATQKNQATDLQATLDKLTESLNGLIGDAKKSLTNPQLKPESILQQLVGKLADTITTSGINMHVVTPEGSIARESGPLQLSFLDDPVCGPLAYYYSVPPPPPRSRQCPRPVTGGAPDCLQCIKTCMADPNCKEKFQLPTSVDDIKQATNDLLVSAGSNVAAQKSLIKEDNPRSVLTAVNDVGENRRRARDFLEGTDAYLDYLSKERKDFVTGAMEETVKHASKRVKDALAILNKPTPNKPGKDDSSRQDLINLAEILVPSGNTFDLGNEVILIVRQDLDDKIAHGKIEKNLADLMQLSFSGSLGEMLKNYVGLDKASTQSDMAKVRAKKNLAITGNFFKEQIGKKLETIGVAGISDPAEQRIDSLFCIQLLLIPDANSWREPNIRKACQHRIYNGRHGENIVFDDLIGLDPRWRICSVYDFFRNSRLHELTGK